MDRQDAEGQGSLPADAGIGRVALRVGDLDRQVAFYRDVLGLTVYDREGARAAVGAGDDTLFVFRERSELPPRAADETGLFHAAIRVPSRAALGDALGRIEERWRLTGASDHLVSEALYLDDPEGNGLEIYRDRPREDWPIAADGTVAMETRPLGLAAVRDAGRGRDRAPPETDVGHVHLEVSAVDATQRFYTEGLGMRVRQAYGESAVFHAAGDYHHHVGANVWNERTQPGEGRGLDWYEVRVPDDTAVGAARTRFEALGREPTTVDGGIAVVDPDGIRLRVRTASA